MLLPEALCRLLHLFLGWLGHRVPTPVVVLLPAGTGVLVNIAIVPGVHVATGILSDSGISVGGTRPRSLASLRGLHRSHRSVGIGRMLGIRGVAVLADHRLSPRSVGIPALASRPVRSGVGVVRLAGSAIAVGIRR